MKSMEEAGKGKWVEGREAWAQAFNTDAQLVCFRRVSWSYM